MNIARKSDHISGIWTVIAVIACLVFASTVIPFALHLPRWLEVEAVFAAWWIFWVVCLSYLLHRGARVTDDASFRTPRNWLKGKGDGSAGVDTGGCLLEAITEPFACAEGFGIIVAVLLVFAGIWLLVELLVPGVAFCFYFLTRALLAHAVNERRNCKGSVTRALGTAVVWASLYTAPLASIVWLVHRFAVSRG